MYEKERNKFCYKCYCAIHAGLQMMFLLIDPSKKIKICVIAKSLINVIFNVQ